MEQKLAGLKKMYHYYKKRKFLCSFNFRRFRHDGSRRRVVLIDTPEHGNLGDQAIALAEQKFIEEMLKCGHYEFTQAEYLDGRDELTRFMRQGDILLIHGGGFMGTLWQNEEDVLIQLLSDFRKNKIVIFPQTVFFEKTGRGISEKKRLCGAIRKCAGVKFFLRDQASYKIMTEEMGLPVRQCFLVPDIVTYLKAGQKGWERTGVLFCMRRDKEMVSDGGRILEMFHSLTEAGVNAAFTDTVVDRRIGKKGRKKAVEGKLSEFSAAKLVITDRIHGMIFAAVTGTPCIAMDNVSGKVSGAYEWIRHLDYVQFVDEKRLTLDLVWDMMGKKGCAYSNAELQGYYDLMKKEIEFDGEQE